MARYPLLLLAALTGCSQAPACSSRIIDVARDPGSDRYAATEARDCEATANVTTVVRVGRGNQARDDADIVFAADSGHGDAASGKPGTIWTNVVWVGPGHLQIARASRARIFKQVAASGGAVITYRATDPIAPVPVP